MSNDPQAKKAEENRVLVNQSALYRGMLRLASDLVPITPAIPPPPPPPDPDADPSLSQESYQTALTNWFTSAMVRVFNA